MKYPALCIVEIHHAGTWWSAGELRVLGPNKAAFTYREDYVFGNHALSVSLALPVGLWPPATVEGLLGPEADHRPPSFMYDLVPQGRGRRFLLDTLQLPDSDECETKPPTCAWPLPAACARTTRRCWCAKCCLCDALTASSIKGN